MFTSIHVKRIFATYVFTFVARCFTSAAFSYISTVIAITYRMLITNCSTINIASYICTYMILRFVGSMCSVVICTTKFKSLTTGHF